MDEPNAMKMAAINGSVRREYHDDDEEEDDATADNERPSNVDKANGYQVPASSTSTSTSTTMTTTTQVADGDADSRHETTTVPTNVAVPPDGGWGWVVVAASFCCNLVVDGIIYSFGMFSTAMVETFGESKAKVALIGSLLSGSYLIAGPFASALANRYGFRSVTIVGAILAGVAFFISSFATSVQFLCFTYGVLGGIGFGLIFVPAVITIGFYFEKWRALATGIAVCGSGIGTFIMAPLSRWLIKQYSWQQALLIQAGFILHCAVFGALFRPLPQMQLQVPVNETTTLTSDAEDATAKDKDKKLPLLLKTQILRDLKGKSVSSLSIYKDVGIIVDHGEHAKDVYFSGNANYPTASQALQLDVIGDADEGAEKPTHINGGYVIAVGGPDTIERSGNNGGDDDDDNHHQQQQHHHHHHHHHHHNNERTPKPHIQRSKVVVTSNRELKTNPHGTPRPVAVRERNRSVSPVLQKRSSLVPETRILLNRKYSLQPPTNSQPLKLGSASTLVANGTKSPPPPINRRHTDIGNRPLYRDDIFFNSNLKRLSKYTSQTSSLNYTMSVTRLPTYDDILEEKKKKFTIFPEAVRRALATMLDLSLLKSITFLILALSGFFTAMGMYTPFLFMTERAERFDMEGAVWLMPVLGIANTVGRVGFGVLSSVPKTNAILINNISLTVCGLCTGLSGFTMTSSYQFGCACVFGATIACFSSIRTIIVVELLGLEKLTNAFGLLLLFQGMAAIIGPPLAGYLVDISDDHELSFYVSGAFIVLSAAICYPIEAICRWENKRKNKT